MQGSSQTPRGWLSPSHGLGMLARDKPLYGEGYGSAWVLPISAAFRDVDEQLLTCCQGNAHELRLGVLLRSGGRAERSDSSLPVRLEFSAKALANATSLYPSSQSSWDGGK